MREPLPSGYTITQLTASDIPQHVNSLSTLLCQCVNDPQGSSIGFHAPLSLSSASTYWSQLSSSISSQILHLFILTYDTSPEILGTVQLSIIPKATHLHRAEVVKLLVRPDARRKGIARMLMLHIEQFAKETGREMLTLDTATETPARDMYKRLGWEEWGTCRSYASWADGTRCDATFFSKDL
ncbi:acyl-CoA N-acyltransferase [Bisporella sp. PMI_857]|nr:acyl-CoA N-acyltransferase [Bisporella sp. PMI_857]